MATVNGRLGLRLRAARERLLLTQEEAAAELGINVRSLQAYEAGRATPRQSRHRAILAWLEAAKAKSAARA